MEFRVFFTTVNCTKALFASLFETSQKFTHSFCLFKTNFHRIGSYKLITTI